ncbi:MAG: trigger factor [Gammaproteobacteria bacterium]|nr:trigger factor [Gammaproteobacteria bacterium]
MQVSVESTGSLERRMTVQVPEERVNTEVQNRLARLARTTRVKGFRPGKVPMKVIEQQYGAQVRMEVIGDVMQSTWYEAVTKENLRPAGHPTIEPKNVVPGAGLEYVATFEVFPELKLAPIEDLKTERVSAKVTDADVDRVIDSLRKQRTAWTTVERAAAAGDRVTIDFTGTIDGQPFKGNEGKNVPVVLGNGAMIPGFEDGLTGAKAGEECTIDVTFPEDYGYKDVAGKAAQFAIKVHQVEEPDLPEVNEEFAKGFGIAAGGADALRAEVRKNMERELEQALKAANKQGVMDKLVEINQVDVPKALVDNESQALMEQMRQNMHVPKGKSMDLDLAIFEPQARRRVSLGLILSELIKSNDIKATPEAVRAQVEKLAASYEHPEEVIKWYYADKRRLSEVESLVLEDQVVEWVLAKSVASTVERSFDEVMNHASAGRV